VPEEASAVKAEELRTKTDAELQEEHLRTREEIARLSFQQAVEQVEDARALRRARKNLARVLTVLRQRELKADRAAAERAVQEEMKADG
jgi:large subunit ribosomal protein L29